MSIDPTIVSSLTPAAFASAGLTAADLIEAMKPPWHCVGGPEIGSIVVDGIDGDVHRLANWTGYMAAIGVVIGVIFWILVKFTLSCCCAVNDKSVKRHAPVIGERFILLTVMAAMHLWAFAVPRTRCGRVDDGGVRTFISIFAVSIWYTAYIIANTWLFVTIPVMREKLNAMKLRVRDVDYTFTWEDVVSGIFYFTALTLFVIAQVIAFADNNIDKNTDVSTAADPNNDRVVMRLFQLTLMFINFASLIVFGSNVNTVTFGEYSDRVGYGMIGFSWALLIAGILRVIMIMLTVIFEEVEWDLVLGMFEITWIVFVMFSQQFLYPMDLELKSTAKSTAKESLGYAYKASNSNNAGSRLVDVLQSS